MTLTNQKWQFEMMFVCHFGLKYGKCLVEIFLHPPTPASGSPMAFSWFLWVILAGLAATIASICEFHLLVFTVTDMCLFYLPSGMDVLAVLLALICRYAICDIFAFYALGVSVCSAMCICNVVYKTCHKSRLRIWGWLLRTYPTRLSVVGGF